jgi:predicted membrane protein (TIGR00267 family)
MRRGKTLGKAEEAANLRNFILGWQDGLVNVLGIVLGVAIATANTRIVLLAGIVAMFAESLSMAAVAYTSSKSAKDFYIGQLNRELKSIDEVPEEEVREIREIFYEKGFRGETLETIVNTITSDRKLWTKTMMTEELHMFPEDYEKPLKGAFTVGVSAIIGSLIPLVPFVFLPPIEAMIASVIVSAGALFATGGVKGKLTFGSWKKSGIEMTLIGLLAAVVGYLIGLLFGQVIAY